MQEYYYLNKKGQQIGPISGEQLSNRDITPHTLVWGDKMSGWVQAGMVEELQFIFQPEQNPKRMFLIQNHRNKSLRSALNSFYNSKIIFLLLILFGVFVSIILFNLFTCKKSEYVDLGLSVKWSTCNVGATKPEDFGQLFSWGEVEPKPTYLYDNSSMYKMVESELKSKRIVDINGNLGLRYDAANYNVGGDWRMPTKCEIEELYHRCNWTETISNGTKGYRVTGPNGNSIFLPLAGAYSPKDGGYYHSDGALYWSSTPNNEDDRCAYAINIEKGKIESSEEVYRCCGGSVRPVIK